MKQVDFAIVLKVQLDPVMMRYKIANWSLRVTCIDVEPLKIQDQNGINSSILGEVLKNFSLVKKYSKD